MEEENKKEETLQEEILKEEKLEEKEQPRKQKEKNKKEKHKIDKEKEELRVANLELKEKVLRITAEMQNIKRRSDADLANAYKYDGMDLAEKLLPVIDNFERALKVKMEGTEKFLDGFKMIYDNLIQILKDKGIIEVEALDKEFDPTIMNAVMTDTNEEKEDNIVLDVLQKGYMYHDKLIRPAMVKVNERKND